MKKTIYIFLLILAGLSCKKEQDKQALPILKAEGTLLDTLSQSAIPNCRVFLLETKDGREQIIAETYTDSIGHFHFDSLTRTNTIQFANNAYAWHDPQIPGQEKYWLKPYVEVLLNIAPMPGYLLQSIRGGFNQSPIDQPSTDKHIPVHASVYDTLDIALFRQKKNGSRLYDTLNFHLFIDKKYSMINLRE